MDKAIVSKVLYVIVILVSMVGILTFLFAPVISVSPEILDIDSDNIKIQYKVTDIYGQIDTLAQKLDDLAVESEEDKSEITWFFVEKFTGVDSEAIKNTAKVWAKLPIVLLVSIGMVSFGFLLSFIWAIIGLFQKQIRWYSPKMISLGGVSYIRGLILFFVGFGYCLHNLTNTVGETVLKTLGVWTSGAGVQTSDMVGLLLRCLSGGLLIPAVCAILIMILGLVIPD